jgi:hypothetical protein
VTDEEKEMRCKVVLKIQYLERGDLEKRGYNPL